MSTTDLASRHAVVVGGSIAGLLAARALATRFGRVTVLERDPLDGAGGHRPGVPHDRHVHILLKRGLDVVEALLPGLKAELIRRGAIMMNQGLDFPILYRSGWSPRIATSMSFLAFTRPLFETAVRERVGAVPRISIRGANAVSAYEATADGRGIRGVRIGGERLDADVVVDTTGRRSRAVELLGAIGFEAPRETVVDASWGYASRMYARPAHAPVGYKQLLLLNRPPAQTRLGVLQTVEGDRWLVNLAGVLGDFPPTSDDGFLAFAKSLVSHELYELIERAQPISPVYGYRNTENRLRHWEELRRPPARFLLAGESLCSFNPVYGQGMTVAALEADLLARLLAARTPLDALARRYHAEAARVVAGPFALATSEDSRWPGAQGACTDLKTRFFHAYIDRIIALIPDEPEVFERFQRVTHMVDGPEALFRPAVSLRVLARLLAARRLARVSPAHV